MLRDPTPPPPRMLTTYPAAVACRRRWAPAAILFPATVGYGLPCRHGTLRGPTPRVAMNILDTGYTFTLAIPFYTPHTHTPRLFTHTQDLPTTHHTHTRIFPDFRALLCFACNSVAFLPRITFPFGLVMTSGRWLFAGRTFHTHAGSTRSSTLRFVLCGVCCCRSVWTGSDTPFLWTPAPFWLHTPHTPTPPHAPHCHSVYATPLRSDCCSRFPAPRPHHYRCGVLRFTPHTPPPVYHALVCPTTPHA